MSIPMLLHVYDILSLFIYRWHARFVTLSMLAALDTCGCMASKTSYEAAPSGAALSSS